MTDRVDIAFLGPSLRHEEARQIYPEAILLPPAAVGDVVSAAARFQPHAIALIDGAFMQNLATYHKEILDVLSRGIWVLGASSMGALRAAECEHYGMIGIGEVYAGYASGAIEDDDEVALSHLDADMGFRPVTEAMVNIRATLAAAARDGVVSEDERQALVDIQKSRWFMERRPLQSMQDAETILGLPQDRVNELGDYLRNHWVDVKGADARAALVALRDLDDGPLPEAERPAVVPSGVYSYMRERDLVVGAVDGLPVTRDQIWRQFALSDTRAPAVMERARLRSVLMNVMVDDGIVLTEDDLARARSAIARDLKVAPEDLESHAKSIDVDAAALAHWIEEEAYVLKAIEWSQYERMNVGILNSCLQQLARMGEYENLRKTAGLIESVAATSSHSQTNLGLTTALKVQSMISSNVLPTDSAELDRFVSFVGLGNRAELYERLSTMIAAHRELFDLPPIEFIPADQELDHGLEPQTSRGR